MKQKFLMTKMFLFLLILLYIPESYSAIPTFNYILTNDTWDSHMVYEVDIIILSTDSTPIELSQITMGFAINNSALNGGTITASYVPGSSELTNTTQINTAFNTTTTTGTGASALRIIKIVGKTPPGIGNGSLLSNVAPGTRIGRLRLTNTVDWAVIQPNNFDMAAQTTYPTSISAYVSGLNTNITSGSTFIKNLTSPLLLIKPEIYLPENYELSQNYPNPFNPATIISYSLPSSSNVRITVYNTLGQTVKVLVNEFKNTGNYSINFNAAELPSGTYFYKLEAGEFTRFKKMMLVK
jgi:hypothetical protein